MDVAVRKPGNVSLCSAGHDMRARQFLDSARASAPALFDARAGVGAGHFFGGVVAVGAALGDHVAHHHHRDGQQDHQKADDQQLAHQGVFVHFSLRGLRRSDS